MLSAATLGLAGAATSANAQCGSYNITQASGGTIIPGTTSTGCNFDDGVTPGVALPFGFSFYGTIYNAVNICSNGNLQFVTSNANYINACLPQTGGVYGATIFPFWDDLYTADAASGEGVFTSVTGVSPNRQFHIEFRTVFCCTAGAPVTDFEIRLFEGSSSFDVIYANPTNDPRIGGNSATIGVQNSDGSLSAQFTCNSGTSVISDGTILHFNAVTGGNTPPSISGGTSPACSVAGGGFAITAQITSAGCPAQTVVSATGDASSVGGSNSVSLHDDGVFPDAVAGDNIFSGSATIAPGTGTGSYNIPVTVTFSGGSVSATGTLSVGTYAAPAGATPEGEDCNQIFPDNFNGGCNSTPFIYSNADFCTNYTGTAANSTSYRDTDWWMFNLAQDDDVTVTGQAAFAAQAFFVLPTCPGTLVTGTPIANPTCGSPDFSITMHLTAGPQVFFISPLAFDGSAICGFNDLYWFRITEGGNVNCAPTGACCQSTGCTVITQAQCTAAGGTYNGDGSHCSSCPPTGGCCTPNGCSVLTAAACAAAGGNYQGDGSACPQSNYQMTQGNTAMEDISSTGTMLFSSAADNGGVALNPTSGSLDDGSVSLPLPFAFSYYGVAQTQIQVATNGYMTFDSSTAECCDFGNGDGIPNTNLPNNMICPPWDDFYYFNTGHVGYQVNGVAPNRRLIIQHTNAQYYPGASSSTFQVILYETSNNIEIRMGTIGDAEASTDPSKVLGIENADGTSAINIPWPGNTAASGSSYLFAWTVASCGPTCDSADFNCDGDVGTDADIEAFFACLAGNCPAPPCNNDADFNNDGDVGTDADIEAFFRVLAGNPC